MNKQCRLMARVLWAGLVLQLTPAAAEMRGHGGSVRALAVSDDGATVLSGSFDSSAILWDLRQGTAAQVLRFHDGAVNAVAFLKDGRAVTAGADARIAVWTPGRMVPDSVLAGHSAPVAALAVSPGGETLASASWDHTIRLWNLARGEPTVLRGHGQNVNCVAFLPDGTALVSAGYDATVRIWPVSQRTSSIVAELPAPLNAVVTAPDGGIAAAGADGRIYFLSPAGERLGTAEASTAPIVALGMSRDGMRVATASINGAVAIVDPKTRRVLRTLVAPGMPGMPGWSVAFLPDGRTLLTGGGDRAIRRWNTETGEPLDHSETGPDDPLAAYPGDPGAQVFRACVACHTLAADQGNRAGPSLYGIFGRRIASMPGYNYSEALQYLDIVWTPETLAKLLEIGPAQYTPGTKMPEQRIGSREDREALVEFLERATQ